MGSFSLFHWIIVAAVVLLLFGRGRISEVMGDFGKGISSFKKGMSESEKEAEREAEIKHAARLQAPADVAPVAHPATPDAMTPHSAQSAPQPVVQPSAAPIIIENERKDLP